MTGNDQSVSTEPIYNPNDLDYVPLHVHSDYSIMDGLQSVRDIIKRAAKLKMPAIALTDWTNICGYIIFYTTALANGIKPIMGADLNISEPVGPGEKPYVFRVTVLAMDREGKQNLYDLLSEAWLRSDAGAFNASNTLEELAKFNKGLILLNGFRGDIGTYVNSDSLKKIDERVQFYLEHFGDRFCFEITRTGREGEASFEKKALELCEKYNICPVASNDTCFLYGDHEKYEDGITDYQVHDVRVSIQNKLQRGNAELAKRYSNQQYLRSAEEMREVFHDLPEALYNTRAIAERCNVTLELDVPRLPRYDTGNLSTDDYLRKASREGLEKRLEFLYKDEKERNKVRKKYEERLEVELDVIIQMGFPGYFLIVMEFIQWSKEHNVPVGPGRGSGGGSLVAYALQITDFDPMEFDLLFERFLNPERVSMPDFDIDFCQRNRSDTIDHVKHKYSTNAVSQIAAFGTMAPKAAIKDVGRALGMTYGAVEDVAKRLPAVPGLTFDAVKGIGKGGKEVESAAPEFMQLYKRALAQNTTDIVDLIHYAFRLEGVIKIIGKHAAGVVISPTRTAEFAPLMLDSDGNPITQFDKKDVEHAGLVKFDFLGLTTLTIIQDAVDMINAQYTRIGKTPFDIHAISYKDKTSYDVIKTGETTAVFQLESDGMRKLICQMKPDNIEDMIALVALYRPGPIKSGMVEHFVNRKHAREDIAYPSPDFQDLDLKPILENTYGVIVYQEQVMQIAQVLAGYSLGGADILRRAMGKKNPAEMASQRSVFSSGAEKKGKDTGIALKIFDQVEKFAEYGFNKSHSAAYAIVAWWTLYLKVHYAAEFLAAMMTADSQRTDKLVGYINECKRLGIKVDSPNINKGEFEFKVDYDVVSAYKEANIKLDEVHNQDFISSLDIRKAKDKAKKELEKLKLAGATQEELYRKQIEIDKLDERPNLIVNAHNDEARDLVIDQEKHKTIIYGLGAIKGIGQELVDHIVEVRKTKKDHKFTDFFDFVKSVGTERLNKKTLESLIFSGALDCLEGSRADMFYSIAQAIAYANQDKIAAESGLSGPGLFGDLDMDEYDKPELIKVHQWPLNYILQQEKLMLGLFLSQHPIETYIEELKHISDKKLANIPIGYGARVYGVVLNIEHKLSQRDQSSFFIVSLDDSTSQKEFFLYREVANSLDEILEERSEAQRLRLKNSPPDTDPCMLTEAPLILILDVNARQAEDTVRYNVTKITTLEKHRLNYAKGVYLTTGMDVPNELISLLARYKAPKTGNAGKQIQLTYCINDVPLANDPNHKDDKEVGEFAAKTNLTLSADLFDSLYNLAGHKNISIMY